MSARDARDYFGFDNFTIVPFLRPPASTKPMEVKLAHQEAELVSLLKKIPLGTSLAFP